MPRPYNSFSMKQVAHLRRHYAEQPPRELAKFFGITCRQLYDLAARHGIRRRAPNGQPVWRQKRNTTQHGEAGG